MLFLPQPQQVQSGGLAIGTATINPATAPTILYGHAICVDDSSAIIDEYSYAFPLASLNQASNPGNSVITPGNGQILVAGIEPAIISGTTVALVPNGASLVINGHSFSIPASETSESSLIQPVLIMNGQNFAVAPFGFAVGGLTVKPRAGAMTVDGTRLSLGSSRDLVIGSSSRFLFSIRAGPTFPMLTVGGQTFLVVSEGFAIGSQKLAPGGAPVTVDGAFVSLGSSDKLLNGSQTMTIPSGGSEVQETVGRIVIYAPIATGSSFNGTDWGSHKFAGRGESLRFSLLCYLRIAIAGLFMM